MLHQFALLSTGCLPHIHGSIMESEWVELWGETPLLCLPHLQWQSPRKWDHWSHPHVQGLLALLGCNGCIRPTCAGRRWLAHQHLLHPPSFPWRSWLPCIRAKLEEAVTWLERTNRGRWGSTMVRSTVAWQCRHSLACWGGRTYKGGPWSTPARQQLCPFLPGFSQALELPVLSLQETPYLLNSCSHRDS